MHQLRYHLAVNGDLIPLKALRIGHTWHFSASKVAICGHEHDTKAPHQIGTYLFPQNP